MRIHVRSLPVCLLLAVCAWPSPASAQYGARGAGNPADGEDYHVEAAVAWWSPDPELNISSESIGIVGSNIDLITDLGVERERHTELRLVLRPARKHKFNFRYLPIKYEADSVVQREFVFNGQRYRVGLPVQTSANLTTYRVGYEYDFFYTDRGFLGVNLDLKYNDVDVELNSPIGLEFTKQAVPIPTIGLTGRGYLARNLSITGEFSYMKVPENLSDDFGGRYFDIDVYATANFTNFVGVQLGYRTIDVNYQADFDTGDLRFQGWWFGAVARF